MCVRERDNTLHLWHEDIWGMCVLISSGNKFHSWITKAK